MRLVTVEEMIALEIKANKNGLSYEQMMRNAGNSLAKIVMDRYGYLDNKTVLGLIGPGNNGGDTLIALLALQNYGWQTTAYIVKERKEDDGFISELIGLGATIYEARLDPSLSDLKKLAYENKVVLDGVLGTGIKLPLKGKIPEILNAVNDFNNNAIIVAVDCPSGTECECGKVDPSTLKADITVCMAALKRGMIEYPAIGYMGEIVLAPIGLPEALFDDLKNEIIIADNSLISNLMPERPVDAHKGTFGTCMVVGGSSQFCGAPILSAKAAYRIGAGLVKTAIPGAIYDAIAGQLLESTWVILPHNLGVVNADAAAVVLQNLGKTKVLLLGPGLGHEKETKAFVEKLLSFDVRNGNPSIGFTRKVDENDINKFEQPYIVFDADALRILAEIDGWHKKLDKNAVLTPHPGEMAALTGYKIADIQKDRIRITKEFAKDINQVVVLKGALTIVASPKGEITIIPIATTALSTAGSGDVLSGMIAGLISQGLDPYDAAIAGCWLHGMIGLNAEKIYGQSASITASDIVEIIPMVLKQITA